MSPYAKFGWFLYLLFVLVAFVPVYWGTGIALTRVLADRPAFALAFAATVIFVGLPFIVYGIRTMRSRWVKSN